MTLPGSSGVSRSLRQEILTTARGLFIEYGYRGLSMSVLARAVGVSKAALYYHFQDKEQLFLAVLNELLDEIEILVDQAISDQTDSRLQIQLLVKLILSRPRDERAAIRLASQEMAYISTEASQIFYRQYQEKFIGKIEGIISSGIRAGELRPVDPSLATWALLGMMFPYFYPAQAGESPLSKTIPEQLLAIYLGGLAIWTK
ncbi:MAG TPA: TetR/AcrR family transcriptional regulator [Anaerolineales bacterium]|nr:TetR/AcrR family transcriptional regulator [Anaerolineales bacterium]